MTVRKRANEKESAFADYFGNIFGAGLICCCCCFVRAILRIFVVVVAVVVAVVRSLCCWRVAHALFFANFDVDSDSDAESSLAFVRA